MQNSFDMAKKIANAASFFDVARRGMNDSDREEANVAVEALHSCAHMLAGERNAEIYSPMESEFKPEEHYRTTVSIKHNNCTVAFSQWRNGIGYEWQPIGNVTGIFTIHSGPFGLQAAVSPTEARQLAAALQQLADDMEASTAQGQRELATMPEAA